MLLRRKIDQNKDDDTKESIKPISISTEGSYISKEVSRIMVLVFRKIC